MEKSEAEKTESTKHFQAMSKKIDRFLTEQNPSDVLIIKAHLICEYYINQILVLRDICSMHDTRNMTFFVKNEKAFNQSDASEKAIFTSLKTLNNLRNKVGHELEYFLSESDIDGLGSQRGKEYIIRKYDFETPEALLRDTLLEMVVDVAFLVFEIVDEQKESIKE